MPWLCPGPSFLPGMDLAWILGLLPTLRAHRRLVRRTAKSGTLESPLSFVLTRRASGIPKESDSTLPVVLVYSRMEDSEFDRTIIQHPAQ